MNKGAIPRKGLHFDNGIVFSAGDDEEMAEEYFYEDFIFDNEAGFHSCKTGRKDYDDIVHVALSFAKKVYGEDMKVSSDGGQVIKDSDVEAFWEKNKHLFYDLA